MDHCIGCVDLCQQLRCLFAMLLWIHFKVHVVEQSTQAPEIYRIAITQFLGKPAHDTLYGQTMENVKGFLVVFLQQSQCLLSCEFHIYSSRTV